MCRAVPENLHPFNITPRGLSRLHFFWFAKVWFSCGHLLKVRTADGITKKQQKKNRKQKKLKDKKKKGFEELREFALHVS